MQVLERNEMNIEACRELFLQEKCGTVLCGFSGGADSTAALLVTFALSRECGFSVVAVHFDHGLRAESASEALWCENFCRERGIEFIKINLDVPSNQGGIENAARQARLAAWKNLVLKYNNACVVTGHHANDKRENFFLRFFRGSNISGLTGLRRKSEVGGVKFLRPLLGFTRREIENYLRDLGVEVWMTDSSNFDSAMLRNYLRNEILPEICKRIGFADSGMAKSIECIECDADFIEQESERAFSSGNCSSRLFWCSLHDALKVRVLRKFLSGRCGGDITVSSAVFEHFCASIEQYSSEPRLIQLGCGIELIIQRDTVSLVEQTPSEIIWNWQKERSCRWGEVFLECRFTEVPDKGDADTASFDADVLGETVILSAPREGEKFVPFGTSRQVSVKKLRIDRKIPSYPVLPAVRNSSGTAVWLPFVRNGNFAGVTPETRRIITFYAKSSLKSSNR